MYEKCAVHKKLRNTRNNMNISDIKKMITVIILNIILFSLNIDGSVCFKFYLFLRLPKDSISQRKLKILSQNKLDCR